MRVILYCAVLCCVVLYRIVLNLVLCICVWVRTSERRHIEYTMDDDCVDDDGEVDKFLDICQCVRVCWYALLTLLNHFCPTSTQTFQTNILRVYTFFKWLNMLEIFCSHSCGLPFFTVIDTFSLTVLGVDY